MTSGKISPRINYNTLIITVIQAKCLRTLFSDVLVGLAKAWYFCNDKKFLVQTKRCCDFLYLDLKMKFGSWFFSTVSSIFIGLHRNLDVKMLCLITLLEELLLEEMTAVRGWKD